MEDIRRHPWVVSDIKETFGQLEESIKTLSKLMNHLTDNFWSLMTGKNVRFSNIFQYYPIETHFLQTRYWKLWRLLTTLDRVFSANVLALRLDNNRIGVENE